jgi:hypothetical protein
MACFSSIVLSLASTPLRKRDTTKAKVKYLFIGKKMKKARWVLSHPAFLLYNIGIQL